MSEEIENYDSTEDTENHIALVSIFMEHFASMLHMRAIVHDASKLKEPEKSVFDKYTPLLKDTTYGSPEYNEFFTLLKPALDHHYANNSHHPEHYINGIDGMDLLDVIEMFCDWNAAVRRHSDGDIQDSIDHNEKRFNMSPQLVKIFRNTAERLPQMLRDLE